MAYERGRSHRGHAGAMTDSEIAASGALSIRSYSLTGNTHSHDFHQVVVPLSGSMQITLKGKAYSVAPGHCFIVPAQSVHDYAATEPARFLVADMACLPKNAASVPEPCVSIEADLRAFCAYADVQLNLSSDDRIAGLLFHLFWQLFARQTFASRLDKRIMRAVERMEADLAASHKVEDLAATACLSVSQFKSLFRKTLGLSCTAFLTARRMDRARSLLMNTDYPVHLVAIEVGYEDASAFSRRFRAHFGQSPRELARGR